jgi:hypothetical protein
MSSPRPRPRDARREPRHAAEGSVSVKFHNPRAQKVEGRLVDLSAGGFRMAHSSTDLLLGLVVEFTHAEAKGSARVVWNRIMENRVETGFLILSAKP